MAAYTGVRRSLGIPQRGYRLKEQNQTGKLDIHIYLFSVG